MAPSFCRTIRSASPSGTTRELTLAAGEPGEWRATVPANELGLWQATDGTLKALINVGPTNPKEFSEVTSTTDMLRPLALRARRRRFLRLEVVRHQQFGAAEREYLALEERREPRADDLDRHVDKGGHALDGVRADVREPGAVELPEQ